MENLDKRRFQELAEDAQRGIIHLFERAERALLGIPRSRGAEPDRGSARALELMARSLVNGRADIFGDAFNRVHGGAERILDELLEGVAEGDFNNLAAEIKLQPGKTRNKLTYGEKIRILRKALETRVDLPVTERALAALSHTVETRNDFFHQRTQDTTLESLVAAIEGYGEFLRARRTDRSE